MTAPQWKVGERIEDHWEIYKILRGGMGIVYIVYDDERREAFAAKTFKDEVFARDPGIAAQFVCEARSWLNLDAHPNVVRARYVETIREKPFLFLEYVSGGDLSGWIGTPRLTQDLPQVLRFAINLCDGMSHALSKGIQVHRDIKPQNCLVAQDNELKVTDFGLAKVFDDTSLEETHDPRSTVGLASYKSSVTGQAAGTYTHMAPEQFEDAKHVDVRADIYSFGVMLFQMVKGKLPFDGPTWKEVVKLHRTAPPPPLESGQPSLDSIVQKCLARKAAERYAGFGTLREEFASIYESMTNQPAPKPAAGRELKANELNAKAISLVRLGRPAEALACFDDALAINSESAEGWSNKGVPLATLGRTEEALACIDRALVINPQYAKGWYNKGVALGLAGRTEEAIAAYDRALEINLNDVDPWFNKGIALRDLGRAEEALACFDRVLALNTQDTVALSAKGIELGNLKRYEESLACFDRMLVLNPQDAMAWSNKGVALGRLGRYEERLACLEQAVLLDPQNTTLWSSKGNSLGMLGRHKEALACFDRALALDPRDANTWSNKAYALGQLGRSEESPACFDRIIALNPRDARAWDDKGLVLGSLGRHEEALACFNHAVSVAPEFASAWYHKGIVLSGPNVCEAIRCFQEALQLGDLRAAERIAICKKS